MNRENLLERIKSGNYTQDKLIGWITAMPATTTNRNPAAYQTGDVLMHTIFRHPYVLLYKNSEDEWVCGMLTSEADCEEILIKCQSRFFSDSYFTKVLITVKEPTGTFMNVYDNKSHLKKVSAMLQEVFLIEK